MGPEVRELEGALSQFCGAQHAITCSNGTDALGLILMAFELDAGDAVLCPSFTFAATAEAISWFGATPVFVDIDERTSISTQQASRRASSRPKARPEAVGVITVDLFGQPADYDRARADLRGAPAVAFERCRAKLRRHLKGRNVGTIGTATATSFFPAKPLGCYGDGGAVFTDDAELAATHQEPPGARPGQRQVR